MIERRRFRLSTRVAAERVAFETADGGGAIDAGSQLKRFFQLPSRCLASTLKVPIDRA